MGSGSVSAMGKTCIGFGRGCHGNLGYGLFDGLSFASQQNFLRPMAQPTIVPQSVGAASGSPSSVPPSVCLGSISTFDPGSVPMVYAGSVSMLCFHFSGDTVPPLLNQVGSS